VTPGRFAVLQGLDGAATANAATGRRDEGACRVKRAVRPRACGGSRWRGRGVGANRRCG